jgi:hypothetical protein
MMTHQIKHDFNIDNIQNCNFSRNKNENNQQKWIIDFVIYN